MVLTPPSSSKKEKSELEKQRTVHLVNMVRTRFSGHTSHSKAKPTVVVSNTASATATATTSETTESNHSVSAPISIPVRREVSHHGRGLSRRTNFTSFYPYSLPQLSDHVPLSEGEHTSRSLPFWGHVSPYYLSTMGMWDFYTSQGSGPSGLPSGGSGSGGKGSSKK